MGQSYNGVGSHRGNAMQMNYESKGDESEYLRMTERRATRRRKLR